MSRGPLVAEIKLQENADGIPPSHHVLAPAPGTTWTSYLPHWDPQPEVHLDGSSSLAYDLNHDHSQTRLLADEERISDLSSCLPTTSSSSSSRIALQDPDQVVRIGFRNPWPSAHKPTIGEVWQGLQWGEDQDPAIPYAIESLTTAESKLEDGNHKPYRDNEEEDGNQDEDLDLHQGSIGASSTTSLSKAQKCKLAAKELLRVQEPDFRFDSTSNPKLKATWLGHAGVLLQLPPLHPNAEPMRILFDPIFSQRCSPTQLAGPIRSYPAPCPISALPPIDIVIISHNHYDHLDYETVKSLWELNENRLRFVVPLGNKAWFVNGAHPTQTTSSNTTSGGVLSTLYQSTTTTSGLGIPQERVTELDWWDQVILSSPSTSTTSSEEGSRDSQQQLKITCTPAQHGSGRLGVDANCALWSSWFVEHVTSDGSSNKIFFGGDTGCQFHGADFPPPPPSNTRDATNSLDSDAANNTSPINSTRIAEEAYPPCPAFQEIVSRLGTPTFLMLPVSVGATISFLRSYVPLPDSYSPFPRIAEGLTSANHIPPWDAVSVFNQMTQNIQQGKGGKGGKQGGEVCMAIHWGTFISGPEEVLKTLGQLRWACEQQNVHFARNLPTNIPSTSSAGKKKTFVALDHGASITL